MRVSLTIPPTANLVSGQNPYCIPFMARTETRLFNWTAVFSAAGVFNLNVNVSCYRNDTDEYVEMHRPVAVYADVPMPNYTRSYLPHEWVGGGSPMDWHGDDVSWQYTLPFDFSFYGVKYRTIYISSNGLITFIASDSSCGNSIQGLAGKPAIAPAWDDWKTSDPYDICIWQNSTHVGIRWYVSAFYAAGISTNFEAILWANDQIQFNYGQNNGTISATVGISNGQGSFIAEDLTNLDYTNTIVFSPFTHDIVVASVVPSSNEVNEGDPVNITIIVRNNGNFTETFNVTAYANTHVIQTQTVFDLAPTAQTVLTFAWNTTGVAPGNYTMKAEASTVPGETLAEDNVKVNGTVHVISEFPSFLILPLSILTTLLAAIVYRRKCTR